MSASTPISFIPDPTTRAGNMLSAGRVKVTVTDITSGEHITVLFKCFADNRDRQYDSNVQKNWAPCPYADATHVFVEVPNASSDWNDKIGTFYPKTGRWYDADDADPQRVQAAFAAMSFLMDDPGTEYRFQEASECGVCGRELTDPISIDRGIGPECYGRLTGSQHQVKNEQSPQLTLANAEDGQRVEHHGEPISDLVTMRRPAEQHTSSLNLSPSEIAAFLERASTKQLQSIILMAQAILEEEDSAYSGTSEPKQSHAPRMDLGR